MSVNVSKAWEKIKPIALKRVEALERALGAAAAGELSDEERAAARGDAHKLHGTLGSFGFPRASELAGELEQELGQPVAPGAAAGLAQRLQELRGALQAPAEPPAEDDAAVEGPPVAVLALDDDAIALAVLRRMLSGPGIDLRAVRREAEFWAALDERRPDVVVLDLEMDGHSGRDICQLLRERSDTSNLPVLIVSASNDEATRHSLREAGVDECLSKPLQKDQLLVSIRRQVARAR